MVKGGIAQPAHSRAGATAMSRCDEHEHAHYLTWAARDNGTQVEMRMRCANHDVAQPPAKLSVDRLCCSYRKSDVLASLGVSAA